MVEVMVQDANGDAPTLETLQTWHATYPSDVIAVVAESSPGLFDYANGYAFPALLLLDQQYKWVVLAQSYDDVERATQEVWTALEPLL